MFYVSEKVSEKYVSEDVIYRAVSDAFVAMSAGHACNFPTVREVLRDGDVIFGIKSGVNFGAQVLGLKAGGFWTGNTSRGLTNHQSSIVLFNPDTGEVHALVRGNHLTGLRTAAASSLSIQYLSRPDSRVLGVMGAGTQSPYQVKAALAQRSFDQLLISDTVTSNASQLSEIASQWVERVRIVSTQELVESSCVVITLTPSFQAIVKHSWVQAGTHFACMGADTIGKQEIDAEIVAGARIFCDDRRQAVTIGECQHAFNSGLIREEDLTSLGEVICGDHPGRAQTEDITVFDGTGVGLQDIVAAKVALAVALDRGLVQELE